MNRIVLIGNGFDQAHNLKTSYQDFIDWYWRKWGERLLHGFNKVEDDGLCFFALNNNIHLSSWYLVWTGYYYKRENPLIPWDVNEVVNLAKNDRNLCKFEYLNPFFENICKSVETKGWVDIENEYYNLLKKYTVEEYSKEKLTDLNRQLHCLKNLLLDYLGFINQQEINVIESLRNKIYAPIKMDDIAVAAKDILKECVDAWMGASDILIIDKIHRYGLNEKENIESINYFKENYRSGRMYFTDIPRPYLLPDAVMLLNFNYTHTAQLYHNAELGFVNYIHGKIDDPQGVIFGYGDELDDDYKRLQMLNDSECLRNVKSIRYLETDNYRNLLAFAEAAPFQVCIMGHSCGNSDRTLLNTLFEHRNCISIKPYYHLKSNGIDNYIEIVQNISRNFRDMKLMRDRVVNKQYCEPLVTPN